MTIADIFAPLGVRIVAGPLELRALTDDDLVELAALAERGVHPPERMPFYSPWTDAPAGELARNTAQYHWRSRVEFSAARWELNLGVWRDGVLLGVSRKVGYVENGRRRLERRPGELAVNIGLVLTPEAFVRGEHDLVVEGVEPFRRLIGLDFETGRSVPR